VGPQVAPLVPGFDDFGAPGTASVAWSITGQTFTATLTITGDATVRQFGFHLERITDIVCQTSVEGLNSAFGSRLYQTGGSGGDYQCFTITRQGVMRSITILRYTDAPGNAAPAAGEVATSGGATNTATLVATGVQPGEYEFQFTVRSGTGDSGLNVIWQSGTPPSPTTANFGDVITMTVCGAS